MKIQLKLLNAYGDTVMINAIDIPEKDSEQGEKIENALTNLIHTTWVLRPGDTIKIVEI